jgi:hypothetical protein
VNLLNGNAAAWPKVVRQMDIAAAALADHQADVEVFEADGTLTQGPHNLPGGLGRSGGFIGRGISKCDPPLPKAM